MVKVILIIFAIGLIVFCFCACTVAKRSDEQSIAYLKKYNEVLMDSYVSSLVFVPVNDPKYELYKAILTEDKGWIVEEDSVMAIFEKIERHNKEKE